MRHGFNCLKKSLPLSSTRINAGKSSVIFQIASIPSSGYSTFDALNIVLRQDSGKTADRAEIETAVLLASIRNLLAAVTLATPSSPPVTLEEVCKCGSRPAG